MIYPIEHLRWDSELFGKKIGSISLPDIHDPARLAASLGLAKDEGYEMVYLFSAEEDRIDPDLLVSYNGHKVSTKVVFTRILDSAKYSVDPNIRSYAIGEPVKRLIDLSRASGAYSRFKLDPRFSTKDFNELYDTWISRSVSRKIADEVFVHSTGKMINGLVTVAIKDELANVGLLSVSPMQQGKGLGTLLLNTALVYSAQNGVRALNVPTQRENLQAVEFYTKKGFQITSATVIHHFF